MQSRKDQVQAHMFVMGRLTSGVLRLEPDGLDQPVTRTSRGLFGGIVLAVLICLVVALFAFILPGGNNSWKQTGTLVVVKDTGARYLSIDGVLHPVANLASAKLLAGQAMTVKSVSAKSLGQAPRGPAIGLMGAPDSLPDAKHLLGQTWTACSTSGPQSDGTPRAGVSLSIASGSLAPALPKKSAVAVSGPDGNSYLLWDGMRMRLDSGTDVTALFGAGAASKPQVAAGLLDVIPAGPDLAVPATAGAGRKGPELAGQDTRIGQLFADNRQNHYLLTQPGLVALTPTLVALYEADPRTQAQAYGGKAITVGRLGPGDIDGHRAPDAATTALTHENQLPVDVPAAVTLSSAQTVCEQNHAGELSTVVAASNTLAGSAPEAGPGIFPSCTPAQSVAVAPGHGALVMATLSGGGVGPTYYLVTDSGVKYPVASGTALEALGYGASASSPVPSSWTNLLPTGPVLDPSVMASANTVAEPPAPSCAGQAGPAGT